MRRAVVQTCRSYGSWATDLSSFRDPWETFDREFNLALKEIDPKSTPGYCCLTTLGTTNGEILGWDGIQFDPAKVSLVKDCVRLRYSRLLAGEQDFDDIKVFVKQEAHKLSKIVEGRFRLISAVSLIDTFVDRILFGWMGRAMLNSVGRTPCLVGWSPVRGGWRMLSDKYRGRPTVCLDKEAWDWTVPEWMVDYWMQVIFQLAHRAPDWWREMVKLRFRALFRDAVFQFEDGTRVWQEVWGIMKSGCYLTILLNSLGQSGLHYVAADRCGDDPAENEPDVIGDDTAQKKIRNLLLYVAKLEELGVIVKGAKVKNHVEFAGFAWDGKVCWPAYWQKHLYNMAHSPNLRELLQCYQYLYVHEPVMYEFICRVGLELDPSCVLPRIVALDIMDHSH